VPKRVGLGVEPGQLKPLQTSALARPWAAPAHPLPGPSSFFIHLVIWFTFNTLVEQFQKMPIPWPGRGNLYCSGSRWGLERNLLGLTRVHALRAGPSGWKSPHVISQREGLVLVAGGRGAGALVTLAAPPLTHSTCAASSQESSALGTGSPPLWCFCK